MVTKLEDGKLLGYLLQFYCLEMHDHLGYVMYFTDGLYEGNQQGSVFTLRKDDGVKVLWRVRTPDIDRL